MASPARAETQNLDFAPLPLESLHESKTNPRRHFAGLDELTASIKQHGVLTPLLVRPVPSDEQPEIGYAKAHPTEYELVAGARRYRAAKAAKLETVPCRILKLTDEQALEFQVIENLQREDVHPLDEANGYAQLVKSGKYNVAAIAAKVNKSERYVQQRMQLAHLIAEAQKAFFEDKFSASHAAEICRLQPKQQKEALRSALAGKSVRELKRWVEYNVHLDLAKAAFPTDDKEAVKSSELVPGALACIDCPKRSGASPELFHDVKKADTCTDPQCYHAKEVAFVKIQLASHPDAKPLSSGYFYGEKPKGLTNWKAAGAIKCKTNVQGVVVQVSRNSFNSEHKLGQVLNVCANQNCKAHNPASGTGYRYKPSKAEKAAAERRKATDAVRSDVDRKIVTALYAKAEKSKALPTEAMRLIVARLADNFYGGDDLSQSALELAFGKGISGNLDRAVAKLKPAKLSGLAVALAVSGELGGSDVRRLGADVCRWGGADRKKLIASAVKEAAKAKKAAKPQKGGKRGKANV